MFFFFYEFEKKMAQETTATSTQIDNNLQKESLISAVVADVVEAEKATPVPKKSFKTSKPKRFNKKQLRDNLQAITKGAVRRLARRGGVKRMSGAIYEEARQLLRQFVESTLRDTITYTEYGRRKTVVAMDVIMALKNKSITLYGYGDNHSNHSNQKIKATTPILKNVLGSSLL